MQRKVRFLLCAALALAVGGGAAAAEEVKIGIIDIEQALFSTEEGKAAREELRRKGREAQAELEPLYAQHKTMVEELQGKKYVLSDEAQFQRQVQLAELTNKIKSREEELQGQLKIEQGKMLAKVQTKLQGIIEAIGKEQGFALILSRNNPYVMYSREALDITDQVVARYNKQG
jgi:outer membrane protein